MNWRKHLWAARLFNCFSDGSMFRVGFFGRFDSSAGVVFKGGYVLGLRWRGHFSKYCFFGVEKKTIPQRVPDDFRTRSALIVKKTICTKTDADTNRFIDNRPVRPAQRADQTIVSFVSHLRNSAVFATGPRFNDIFQIQISGDNDVCTMAFTYVSSCSHDVCTSNVHRLPWPPIRFVRLPVWESNAFFLTYSNVFRSVIFFNTFRLDHRLPRVEISPFKTRKVDFRTSLFGVIIRSKIITPFMCAHSCKRSKNTIIGWTSNWCNVCPALGVSHTTHAGRIITCNSVYSFYYVCVFL